MSGRKRVNRSHPDFPEYLAKCQALQAEYQPRLDAIEQADRAKYPNWRGMDFPWSPELRIVEREYNAKLRELQEKYDYLFTVDIEED